MPTHQPKNSHSNYFDGITVGEAITADALTMYPILGDDRPGPAYITLAEALNAKLAHIEEVSQGGSVPELLFRNDGDLAILLLDGEELIGAKQNRVLNITILAPANASMKIPVSCVERGRWSYEQRDFRTSSRTLFAKARHAKMQHVSEDLKANRRTRSDQDAVWSAIDQKLAMLRAAAPSSAMSDAYESRSANIEGMVARLHTVPQQRGAVFAINGRLEGVELFNRADTLVKLLPTILRGYALDAIEHPAINEIELPKPADVSGFLGAVGEGESLRYPASGLGEDIRIEAPEAVGAALDVDGSIVHLAAFKNRRGTGSSRSIGRPWDRPGS